MLLTSRSFFFVAIIGLASLCLSILVYQTFEVMLVSFVFWLVGLVFVSTSGWLGKYRISVYNTVFAVHWLFAGVGGFYLIHLSDPSQLYSDSSAFYELASDSAWKLGIQHIQALSEGSLAIVVWTSVYDLFAWIGFEKQRYIGLLVNVWCMSLTCLLGVRMCETLFLNNPATIRRFVLLFNCCGLYWLFSAVHLRDSFATLLITAVLAIWVDALTHKRFGRFLGAVALTAIISVLTEYVRDNFVLVPAAIAGIATLSLVVEIKQFRRLSLLIAPPLLLLVLLFVSDLYGVNAGAGEWRQAYAQLALDSDSNQSLGVQLITSQPLVLRTIFGVAYLWVFPVPFWVGIQFDTAYHLFKSLNVIYFYFLVPLVSTAVVKLYDNHFNDSRSYFLLVTTVVFSIVVAVTSLETRHLGAFLIAPMVLAVIPWIDSSYARVFLLHARVYIVAIALIHFAWFYMRGGIL